MQLSLYLCFLSSSHIARVFVRPSLTPLLRASCIVDRLQYLVHCSLKFAKRVSEGLQKQVSHSFLNWIPCISAGCVNVDIDAWSASLLCAGAGKPILARSDKPTKLSGFNIFSI